jgi:hypothetical protein
MAAVNMPLLAERKNQEPEGYKNVAPPEQEPRHNEDHFSGKAGLTHNVMKSVARIIARRQRNCEGE